jgi:hypothetical protein
LAFLRLKSEKTQLTRDDDRGWHATFYTTGMVQWLGGDAIV